MNETEIAYLAGILDARGSFEINIRHAYPQPRLRVTTRRVELLGWLAEKTGTGVVEDTRGYHRKLCGEHCTEQHVEVVRQSASWMVDSSRATVVLYNVQPHLISQQTEGRKLLLAGLERFPPARGDVPKQMAKLGWKIPSVDRVSS